MSLSFHIFQPDKFCAFLEKAFSRPPIVCNRVAFAPNGVILVDMVVKGENAQIYLGPLSAAYPGAEFGCHSVGVYFNSQDPISRVAGHFVTKRLQGILKTRWIPLFDLFVENSPEAPITFGTGLFRDRLSQYLVPAKTTYKGFVFGGEVFEEPATILYSFESAWGSVKIGVILKPHQEPVSCFLETEHLSLFVASDERLPEQRSERAAEGYLGFLLSRCDNPKVRFEIPKKKISVVADGAPEFGADLDCQFFAEEHGHDFFDLHYVGIGNRGPLCTLIHSERDCANYAMIEPVYFTHLFPSLFSFVPKAHDARHFYISDIGEKEILLGGIEKLERSLERIASCKPVSAILVGGTCHTRVLGEDIQGLVTEKQGSLNCKIIYHDIASQQSDDKFKSNRTVWQALFESVVERCVEKKGDRINLVGYGTRDTRMLNETVQDLSSLGVEVGCCFLPELDWEEGRYFLRSCANVVNPWEDVRRTFEGIEETCGLKTIVFPLPLGLNVWEEWFFKIDSALRLDTKKEKVCELIAPYKKKLEALREETRRFTVAFVVISTQTHSVLDSKKSHGFLLPAFLGEAGFNVVIFYYDPPELHGNPKRIAPEMFLKTWMNLSSGGTVDVKVYHNKNALNTALQHSNVDLCYSEIRFDIRLFKHGIPCFSVEDLEYGLAGTLRTVERLIRKAKDPIRRLLKTL